MPTPCIDHPEVVVAPDAMDIIDRNCKAKVVYIVTHAMSARLLLKGQLSYMRERGFDVTLITAPHPTLRDIAEREGVNVLEIPMEREISVHHDLGSLLQLIRSLRALRPDLVFAATPKAGLLGMIAARLAGVPARIYAVYGLRLETARGLKLWILSTTERIAAGCAQRVLCVSKSLRETFVRMRLCSREKTRMAAGGSCNGVNAGLFERSPASVEQAARLRAELGIPPNAPVIGFAGRLTRDKGIIELLAGFRQAQSTCQDAVLLLLGGFETGDPLPDSCINAIADDPHVVHAGEVVDIERYYHVMDLFCLPSFREGLPTVVMEAAAASLPTVGFRVTGVMDAIVDGVTGTLVAPYDVDGLAAALVRYLSSPTLRSKHGAAAHDWVVREFRQDRVWAALHAEFVDVIQNPRTRRRTVLPVAAGGTASQNGLSQIP